MIDKVIKVIKIIKVYVYRQCKMSIKRLRTNELKRVKEGNNTPDNKGMSTGLVVHVLPQEKRNIDVIIDVFGLVENGKL